MVIDSNLLVIMLTNDSRRPVVRDQFIKWLDERVELFAPQLASYEVLNALTREHAAGGLQLTDAAKASEELQFFPITYHPIQNPKRVLEIASALRRKTAYDAAYIALAEQFGTELWTADGPLYRNASGFGFPVHLLA